jgi:ribosomal protein S18 acetylase RimI-like enzyme
MNDMNDSITIRAMTIEDYDNVYALWQSIDGFGIRSIDDSRDGVARFLRRNPGLSVVAVVKNVSGGGLEPSTANTACPAPAAADSAASPAETVVGAILCGEDGRRGCLYHVCVRKGWRLEGIGTAMVTHCMHGLRAVGINKVSLIAFTKNDIGNTFWKTIGWTKREDLNYYDFTLNEENITRFIGGQ